MFWLCVLYGYFIFFLRLFSCTYNSVCLFWLSETSLVLMKKRKLLSLMRSLISLQHTEIILVLQGIIRKIYNVIFCSPLFQKYYKTKVLSYSHSYHIFFISCYLYWQWQVILIRIHISNTVAPRALACQQYCLRYYWHCMIQADSHVIVNASMFYFYKKQTHLSISRYAHLPRDSAALKETS